MITRIIACVSVTSVSILFGYTEVSSRIASFHGSLITCAILNLELIKAGRTLSGRHGGKGSLGVKGLDYQVKAFGGHPVGTQEPGSHWRKEATRRKPRLRWGRFGCIGQID